MPRTAPILDRAGCPVTQAAYDALVAEVERLKSMRGARILRLPAVLERVGLAKTQVYELVAAGRFPAPLHLTERAVGWLEHEVERFLRERAAARAHAVERGGPDGGREAA